MQCSYSAVYIVNCCVKLLITIFGLINALIPLKDCHWYISSEITTGI